MYEAIEQAERLVAAAAPGLEPGVLSGADAAALLGVLGRLERLLAGVRVGLARRLEESNHWRSEGHRSAASWLATKSGTSMGSAVATLETARRLEGLPATAEALGAGRLSEAQAAEIASAAAANPAAEARLLADAPRQGLDGLKRSCRAAKAAAAATDPDAAYRAIHRSRYLRHWIEGDGAVAGRFRLSPDDGAYLLAAVEVAAGPLFAAARAEGRREPPAAYAADALVALARRGADADGGGEGPSAVVHLRVDQAVWDHGEVGDGGCCEIDGVGPVAVSVARRLGSDAIFKAIVTDGVDVVRVVHVGRSIPAHLRTALAERDPTCCVPGCEVRRGLEIDHRVPFAEGGPTSLDNLARLCHHHHLLKTHHGYHLEGGPGCWSWRGPPDPAGP